MATLTNWIAQLRLRIRRQAVAGLLTLMLLALLQLVAPLGSQAQQSGSDFDHSSTGFVLNAQHQNVRCETCHLKGVFKGTPKTCEACHGWTNPRATFSVMPTNHIPTGNASCESCHQANMAQFVDAVNTFNHVAVRQLTCVNCHSASNPHPNVRTNPADATHTAVMAQGQACDKCHTTIQFTGPKIPTNHIPTAAVACTNCHTDANYAVMPTITAIHANAPSSSSNCQQCHSSAAATAFSSANMVPALVAPPSNHIAMNGQSCETCHIATGSSVQVPIVDGAKFSNASFSHAGITSGCASCHGDAITSGSFLGVTPKTRMGLAPAHIASSQVCEDCHTSIPAVQIPTSGALAPNTFAGGQFNHRGVSSGCDACHGANVSAASFYGVAASSLVLKPATLATSGHLPTTAACEACHSAPSAAVSVTATHNVPGSQFASPLPTAAAIHSGVTGSCNNCHEAGMAWTGVAAYTRAPTQYLANASYTGFQTRPNGAGSGYSVADTNHPPAPTDCSACHLSFDYFSAPVAPAHHIPYVANTACGACHTSFGTAPSISAIHANIQNPSGNCAQCHSAAAAQEFAPTTLLRPIVAPVANHVPMGNAGCESCHVGPGSSMASTPVLDGAKFSGSAFSHSASTVTCATCHGGNTSYYGIASIVAMPPTSPPGLGAHMPTAAACDSCHVGVVPAGQLSVTAAHSVPGSLFQNPAPTSATIHAGVSNCNSCHEAGMNWMGMTLPAYARQPAVFTGVATDLYTGFQSRPVGGGTATSVDDPAHLGTGECSQCHGNTLAFGAPVKPDNHIPYDANVGCAACHGNFSGLPKVSSIHLYSQSIVGCDQCHGTAKAAYYSAGMKQAIVTLPDLHISVGGLSCEGCHVGANSSIASTPVPDGAKFSGSLFNHANATVSCATCHGPTVNAGTFKGVFPKTMGNLNPAHVPTAAGAACDSCHTNGAPTGLVPAAGMTTFANAQFLHPAANTGCETCHGPTMGNNSFYGINPLIVMPSTAAPSGHLPTSTSCATCHLGSKPAGLIPASSGRSVPGSLFKTPAPDSVTIHSDAPGSCNSCHEAGLSWIGMDLLSPPRTTSGSGNYYGFQTRPLVSASGYSVADAGHPDQTGGDCSLCHGDTLAFGQPSAPTGHIPYRNGTACATCHVKFGTAPAVGVIHANLESTSSNCQQCHDTTNAVQYKGTTTLKPIQTQDSSFNNHIPLGGLDCSACHVGAGSSIASTPVPEGARFSGSAFIHTGISTGCGECHGAGVAAGTFYGVTPKSQGGLTPSHIPVNNSVGCETCHTNSIPPGLVPSTGYTGSPSFAGGQFIHTYITSGCATCHGPGVSASSFKGVSSIVVMATSGANAHIPTNAACENCHAGSGSIPAGLLSVTAAHPVPGSGFQVSPPDSPTIHANVSGTCASCHEGGLSWVGVGTAYPRNKQSLQSDPNFLYTGFHTRPVSVAPSGFSMLDPSHPDQSKGDCALCHGNTDAFGAPSLPSPHIPYASGASCNACHKTWGVAPAIVDIHANLQTSSSCADCHSRTNADTYSSNAVRAVVGPDAAKHLPMRGQSCESCHVGASSSLTLPVQNTAKFSNSAFAHGTGMTSNCAECHGPSITGASFQGVSSIVVMPPSAAAGVNSHIPTSTTCEDCHRNAMPTAQVPGNAPHAAPNSGFLSQAPKTDVIHAGVNGSCNTCHEKGMVWMGMSPYPASTVAPYHGFQTRPYGTATTYSVQDSVHPTAGDCSDCHNGFSVWDANVKSKNHIPTATVSCTNCHTNPDYGVPPLNALIHANAPSNAKCADCHSAANASYYSTPKLTVVGASDGSAGPVHIPMANLDCADCHVGATSSMTSATQTGAKFSNSGFSHANATVSCATCHSGVTPTSFQGGIVPVSLTSPVLSPVHVPNPAGTDCGVCHLNIPVGQSKIGNTSTTFAAGQYSHAGINKDCAICHGSGISGSSFKGITKIVVLPPGSAGTSSNDHIPLTYSGVACETCHLGSLPSTVIPASSSNTTLGATKFKYNGQQPPDGASIHTGVNGVCNVCHEAGKVWLDLSLYPRNYTTKQASTNPPAQYTGFHTRPTSTGGGNSITDANHPGGNTECGACHGSTTSFSAAAVPGNHIPFSATAQCQNCHTNLASNGSGGYVSSSVDFSVPPSITNIHNYAQSTTTNCQQCHSTANATAMGIPAAGAIPAFVIKSPGSIANHIPFGSTACETCHVYTGGPLTTPVTGGTFAGGKFSHAGFTTGCAACHGAGISNSTFTGVTAIVAIAASSKTPGANTHIPYAVNCETCHTTGTAPSGLVGVTATGNLFATNLLVANATIHTNSGSFACKDCHERGFQWLGMGRYTRAPLALNLSAPLTQYTGFQTRPGAAATTYGYTDSGHTGNTTLDTGDCSTCHSGTSYFTAEGKPTGHMPTSVAACSTCHTAAATTGDYSWGATVLSIPGIHTGLTASPSTYPTVPAGAQACNTCHTVGSGGSSGTAPFAGCAAQTAAACKSPPDITYQPMTTTGAVALSAGAITHVPIAPSGSSVAINCNACHNSMSKFSATTMGSAGHTNVKNAGITCTQCHENGMAWTNVSNFQTRTPSKHTTTSRKAPNECSNCHSYNSGGFRALAKPVMRAAQVGPDMNHIRPTPQIGKPSRGSLGNAFDHKGVEAGKCKTCHDGKSAAGMPARHLMVTNSCDSCHRPTTWLPAQFSHSGIMPGTCLACHNGMGASGKPAGHFMTARSCDSCHRDMAWSPVNYRHLSPLYVASPDKLSCVSCHDTNGEIIRRQARALNRTKPLPVGP